MNLLKERSEMLEQLLSRKGKELVKLLRSSAETVGVFRNFLKNLSGNSDSFSTSFQRGFQYKKEGAHTLARINIHQALPFPHSVPEFVVRTLH